METATGASCLPWILWRLSFRSCLRCWYSSDTLYERERDTGRQDGFFFFKSYYQEHCHHPLCTRSHPSQNADHLLGFTCFNHFFFSSVWKHLSHYSRIANIYICLDSVLKKKIQSLKIFRYVHAALQYLLRTQKGNGVDFFYTIKGRTKTIMKGFSWQMTSHTLEKPLKGIVAQHHTSNVI